MRFPRWFFLGYTSLSSSISIIIKSLGMPASKLQFEWHPAGLAILCRFRCYFIVRCQHLSTCHVRPLSIMSPPLPSARTQSVISPQLMSRPNSAQLVTGHGTAGKCYVRSMVALIDASFYLVLVVVKPTGLSINLNARAKNITSWSSTESMLNMPPGLSQSPWQLSLNVLVAESNFRSASDSFKLLYR